MKRPDLAAWVVTGVAVAGIIACALLHVPIPDVLVNLSTASLGAAAGVSFAGSGLGAVLAQLIAKLEGHPASSSKPTLPAPLTVDPPTGVLRPAVHRP